MNLLNARAGERELVFPWRISARKCASADCTRKHTLWRGILDNYPTVQLRGSAFCFPGCFERELRRTLERASNTPIPFAARPRRIPIGLLMLSRGEINDRQLRQALEAQKCAGNGRIGEWMQRLGFVDESDVAAAVARQWACPLMKTLPARLARCTVPTHLLRAFRMVPAHFTSSRRVMHMAFAEGIEYPALVAIEQILDLKTEPCLTTERMLRAALEQVEEIKPEREKLFVNCRSIDEMVRIVSSYAAALSANEARLAACGEFLWIRVLGREPIDLLFLGNDAFAARLRPKHPDRYNLTA